MLSSLTLIKAVWQYTFEMPCLLFSDKVCWVIWSSLTVPIKYRIKKKQKKNTSRMCTWHSGKWPLNSVSIACLLEHPNVMLRWLKSSNSKATPATNTNGYSLVSCYLKAASVLAACLSLTQTLAPSLQFHFYGLCKSREPKLCSRGERGQEMQRAIDLLARRACDLFMAFRFTLWDVRSCEAEH